MSPYKFGQKVAADLGAHQAPPAARAMQPMAKAISTTAKTVSPMLNMARANKRNVLDILNPLSQAVKTRTGTHPSNWEMNEILAQGLAYPQAR